MTMTPPPSLVLLLVLLLSIPSPSSCFAFSMQDYASVGKEIQEIQTTRQALRVAQNFWLPTDADLPPHLRQQAVHHEKRQRWASQLLEQLAAVKCSSCGTSSSVDDVDEDEDTGTSTTSSGSSSSSSSRSGDGDLLLWDERLARLVLAAALPFSKQDNNDEGGTTTTATATATDRLTKEGRWMETSLVSIYSIVAVATAGKTSLESDDGNDDDDDDDAGATTETKTKHNKTLLLQGIQQLIQRSTALADQYPLNQACHVYWAIQGLQCRIPELAQTVDCNNHNLVLLQDRVEALPFAIVPQGLDWSQLLIDTSSSSSSSSLIVNDLLNAIPFSKDVLVTRQGTTVQERRGTAWIANPDVGALAYSGKLMPPQELPPLVQRVMDRVQTRLRLPAAFFDCALCNHYADRGSACKFHTDPEHGSHWDRTTVVVAAGASRKFAFKPVDTNWDQWDLLSSDNNSNIDNNNNNNNQAAVIPLFAGDLVVMTRNCNDDFYHAVHAGDNDDPRISLVLKRALERSGGQKGHSLQGQGRRRKRHSSPTTTTITTTNNNNNNNSSGSRRSQPGGRDGKPNHPKKW
jgi:hypothetical protein